MKRVLVIGVSAGVGKSTFARKLGSILDIEVCHLDRLYWKPNWIVAPFKEFADKQRKVVKQEQWIIEGNYTGTFDIRMKYADTIIYLELPLYICLYRVFKRWINHIGKTRIDMGEGCNEKLDFQFLTFILKTYHSRKRNMSARFKQLEEEKSSINIIRLKSKASIRSYLQQRKMVSML